MTSSSPPTRRTPTKRAETAESCNLSDTMQRPHTRRSVDAIATPAAYRAQTLVPQRIHEVSADSVQQRATRPPLRKSHFVGHREPSIGARCAPESGSRTGNIAPCAHPLKKIGKKFGKSQKFVAEIHFLSGIHHRCGTRCHADERCLHSHCESLTLQSHRNTMRQLTTLRRYVASLRARA